MVLTDSPKGKFFVVCLIIFSIMILCGYVYLSSYRAFTSESPQQEVTNSVVSYDVLYTNSGFVPEQSDIPLGSKIIFRNTADIPLWVASDPHPNHTDLGGFDVGKDLLPGETYVYTFTKSGTFGYHNHRRSVDRGVIRVTDPNHPVPDISKTKSRQAAVRNTLLSMLTATNTQSIFDVVDTIEHDPTLSNDCHDVAHDVGHRAYELFGFSTALTYTIDGRGLHTPVQDICAGGYVHGILEEVFLHQPEMIENAGVLCDSVPEENRASCFHGVGHAVMFASERNIEKSLTACKNARRSSDIPRCFEGVWMEMYWGNTDHFGEESLGWELTNPLKPCRDAENIAKPACYIYAPFGFLRTHNKDYTGAIDLCITSELDASDTRFCLRGVGIAVTSSLKVQQLERVEAFTQTLTDENKGYFYEGVVGYGRLSGVSDEVLGQACLLMQRDTEICQNTIETYR